MIFEKRIQLGIFIIFSLLLIFSTDSVTGRFKGSPEDINDVKSFNSINASEIFALTDQSAHFFPPDTNLTLKQLDSLKQDSIKLGLVKIDSSMYDSTARIKHFQYVRKDNQFLSFTPKRDFSFYLKPSSKYLRRTVELDSTGNFVIIKELIANNEVRSSLKIPIDKYIEMKLNSTERDSWKSLGYEYTLQEGKDDLGQLFSDITNIEIPLPSVPLLSIFGPPKISLKINGAVDIHGAWRNETTEGVTASLLGNTRNEPDFKQTVQINVSGTIGDKLTIAADWNTKRTFEYENQLKLQYKGYKDEIVQSVEAGNVSLQTSPLVGGGEALFGIKALFQFGPFSLTTIASQKKSEVEEVSVSGGSQKSEFEIHAYDYSPNHFFVSKDYKEKGLFEDYYSSANPSINPFYKIKELEVWKTTSATVDISKERRANAFIDLPPRISDGTPQPYAESPFKNTGVTDSIGRNIIDGRFEILQEGIHYDYNYGAGFISFKTQISSEDAIAIAYRIEGPAGSTDYYYGEFLEETSDTSSLLVLKLIKPKNLQPGGAYKDAWDLQLKNIYPIGGRDVKKEGFVLDINYLIPGQDPVNNYDGENLIEAFGLDITDESGTGGPDGAFDFDGGRTIFTETGEIIFPKLEPFGKDLPKIFDPSLAYNAVYDTSVTFAKQDKKKDKFILVGEYSAGASSVYNIGFNIVENSVKVLLNGRTLQEGVDYSVDYNIGQVVIRNEDALVSGANLKITYEKNDLFQLASKTLLGMRGIYDLNEKTKLGFSFLNLNQKTLSDKVRIGEEPMSNSIFGFDFKTGYDLPFITKGLDYLISTKEMSSITLKGEVAYISPDPNTKKSKIASDDKKSIAYIDDFEGAKRTIPIGVSYTGWKDISVPDNMIGIGSFDKEEQMDYKAKGFWFNFLPSDVYVEDIWGDRKKVGRNEDKITALDFYFDPAKRGAYNYNPKLSDKILNWGGMMKPLSSTAGNLVEENIEFIEFWLKVEDPTNEANLKDIKLYIDLGLISEDIIPNRVYDTEDNPPGNGNLEEGEDTGLDGLTNAEEIQKYGDIDGTGDPSGDDFSFSVGSVDYSKINGTEGNGKLSDTGRLPDTEDMDRDLSLDKVNSYFRYEVPLDTSRLRNEFISGGGGNKNWYQFRIPLKDFKEKIGSPSFTTIETIRLWINGVENPVHFRLAELNLVGNQWQKVLDPPRVTEDDTTLVISTINFEDNPEYSSPPGVKRERDRTQTEKEVLKNEQSLQLKITDLEDGDSREIVKYLYRPLDVFSYKEMKLFIHGDLNTNIGSISYYIDKDDYGAEVYFRFGTDSSHFYEYRQPLKQSWTEISILFEELTAIKQVREVEDSIYTIPVEGKPGHFYGVKGRPSLTKINYFSFGIKNPKGIGPEGESVSGELWVNELRVLGADDTPGWAYSASSQVKFADILSVNINKSQTDPFFHKLNQRFGSRVDNAKWGGAVNFNLLKLLPWNLAGSNLSINYSHNESTKKPLYLPSSDIKVEEAVNQEYDKQIANGKVESEAKNISEKIREESETVNISDTWSLSSIRFKLPSKSWYIQDIINNLSFSFSYNKTYSRSPSVVFSRRWVWNGSGKYSLNFSKNNYFFAADIPLLGSLIELFEDYKNVKIYFSPQTFNSGISASRKESSNLSRTENAKKKTQRDFTAKRNMGFNWKLTEGGLINLSFSYSTNIASSYAHLLAINDISRTEKDIWNDILYGSIFGKDYNYSQNFDIKTSPVLPSLWNIRKFLKITMSYGVNYRWSNNFKQEELGRSIGVSNNIRTSVTLKWQSLTSPLFKDNNSTGKSKKKTSRNKRGNRASRKKVKNIDEELDNLKRTETEKPDSVQSAGEPILKKALNYLKLAAKWIFFDYENIKINFSQSNSASSSGIRAEGTGFSNFWGSFNADNGPSRAFMLGLSKDAGNRSQIPGGNLSDNFTQKNTVDFKTSRPLWEGAKINLKWKVGWGLNKNTKISIQDDGSALVTDITSSGNLDRSFIFIPIFVSDVGIVKVNEIYKNDVNKNIANAFVEGFESFPLISKLPILKDVSKYIPRANWRIDWRGLEDISFLKGLARSVSLNHAYTSSYSEKWKVDPDGNKQIQVQRINYGFSPLAGLNLSFDDLWGGNLTGSIKYSTKTSFDLGVTTRNITETFSRDISVTASFSKAGFSLPMFGLDLKNDIEASLSYTSAQNSIIIFEMGDKFTEKGKPQDGTIRTIIEPRIKYTLSSKVTLSIFYKRTSVEPEGASRIPPTTTNEAGLDVHISIQ